MKSTNGLRVELSGRALSVLLLLFVFLMAGSAVAKAQTCPQDQTAAHFNMGTTGANTVVVPDYDGSVILMPASNEEFTGTTTPAGWIDAVVPWNAGGTVTYTGGRVVVNGSHNYSSAFYGPGTSIEFVATFTAGNFQNVGFSTTGAFTAPWVTIGRATQAGTGLYARSNLGSTELELGFDLLNAPHLYKIVWNATNFQFYVDGVLLRTMNQTVATPMCLQISDYFYELSGPVLSVDCMRVTPYVSSGTYLSGVFDGMNPKNWGAVTWNADVPSGTGLEISVRTGDVAVPDGTWSSFAPIPSSGSNAGGTSRYIQYQAVLSTANTLFTPVLKDISISCAEATVIAPQITGNPVSLSSCIGSTVVFTSSAYGYPAPTVQWQISTNDGTDWSNILGENSISLSVLVGSGDNGNQYRALWSNIGGDTPSDAAVLTIGITASIEATDPEICENETVELRLSAATGQAPWSLEVNGTIYNATTVGTVFATFPNITAAQDYDLTSVTDNNGCVTTGSPINTVSVAVLPQPAGSLSAVISSVDQGEAINLEFDATAGTGPYDLIINGEVFAAVTDETGFSAGNSDYTPMSIWGNTTGGEPGVVDDSSLELGFKFRSSVAGLVMGIRFYKRVQQSGTHTGSLWTSTGTRLATGTFTNETTSGWQEMYFDQPVLIQPDVTYVASYYAPNGHYAFTTGYFSTSYTNGPLTALQSGTDGNNGVYLLGAGGGFPTESYNNANYWVDILFDDASPSSVIELNLTSVISSDGCNLTGNPISSASVTVNRSVWTGSVDTDWDNTGNWSTSVIPVGKEVVIPVVTSMNYPIIAADAAVTELTIWPTAGFTVSDGVTETAALTLMPLASGIINGGGALTVNGDLTTTGASLTINSTAVDNNGSLIVNGTSTGLVTYNRQMPGDKYRYISLPVSSATFPTGTFWRWDEVNGRWGEDPVETQTTLAASGMGYTVLASDNTLSFVGTVLNEVTGIVATAPYDDVDIYVQDRATWGGGGWNLLGNPFPSALSGVDADAVSNNDFIHHNLDSFDPSYQAMYIYNGTTYSYIAPGTPGFPGSGTFTGNDVQAGQGFFVLARYDGVEFDFTSAMRRHNTAAIMTKSASAGEVWPGLQLKAKYGDKESSTLIVYNQDMTAGLDPGYDIGLLTSGADVEIYTLLTSDDNDFSFTRQALPVDGAQGIVIPVGIDSEKGGEVTFSAYTVPLGSNKFWLEDRAKGVFTDLSKKTYTTTLPAKTYGTGRFYVVASSTPPRRPNHPVHEPGLRIWSSNRSVIVQGTVSEAAICKIFNVHGELITEAKLTDSDLNTIQLPSGYKGVCIVQVTDGLKVVTKKIAIPR
jgi:hypothetical protein